MPSAVNNTFGIAIESGWVAKKSLSRLKSKTPFFNSMDKRYRNDFFNLDFPIGTSMQVRHHYRALLREGIDMVPQNIEPRTSTVTMNAPFGSDFGFGVLDRMYKMDREDAFKEYMEGAIDVIAAAAERRGFAFAVANTPNIVGALGTNPTDSTFCDPIRAKIMSWAGWKDGEMDLYISPQAMGSIRTGERTTFQAPVEQTKFLREGYLGRVAGFDWHESVLLPRFQDATFSGTFAVGAAGQSGRTLAITGSNNGDVIPAGTILSIDACYPVHPQARTVNQTDPITIQTEAPATIAAGVATLQLTESSALYGPGSPYQNIDSFPGAAAALTIMPGTTSPSGKIGTLGLAHTSEAFFAISAKWPTSMPGLVVSKQRDDSTGLELLITRGSNINNLDTFMRVDVAIGFGAGYSQNCACLVALK